MGERVLKASRELRPGEEVEIHQGGFFRRLRHLADPQSRVGAKLVAEFCLDATPEEELKRRREHQEQLRLQRASGEGRPTKRDRRDLDKFLGKFIEDYESGRL
jgi:ribosome-associated heat shock protein Hsp15